MAVRTKRQAKKSLAPGVGVGVRAKKKGSGNPPGSKKPFLGKMGKTLKEYARNQPAPKATAAPATVAASAPKPPAPGEQAVGTDPRSISYNARWRKWATDRMNWVASTGGNDADYPVKPPTW